MILFFQDCDTGFLFSCTSMPKRFVKTGVEYLDRVQTGPVTAWTKHTITQCLTSLMLLWLNRSKSLQQCSNI